MDKLDPIGIGLSYIYTTPIMRDSAVKGSGWVDGTLEIGHEPSWAVIPHRLYRNVTLQLDTVWPIGWVGARAPSQESRELARH